MAAMRTFYFLVWDLCFFVPVVRLQVTGYFGWISSDGGHCWSKTGVTCSLRPSGCGSNQVNNPWGVGCNSGVNITLNRPTAQSSTANGHPSNLGVDGDNSTCASTTMMTNPTWFVDLPGLHVVHGIRFKGGVYVNNACSNTQITIKVEGIAQGVAVNGTVCAQLSGTASCNCMETINCGSVENPGNRLVIHHTGNGQLRVCELEIIGYQYPYNLAYGKPVMQNGTHASRFAYYAVDGQLGTSQTKPDCTQTKDPPSSKPWWWVDLGSQNVIYSVRLLNIEDRDYYERLKDFTIYVSDKNATAEFSSNEVCHTHSTPIGAASSEEFPCQNGPLPGRYVIVQLNWPSYLQLCEVIVKGHTSKSTSVTQGYFGWTSSDGGHCWSNPCVTCSLTTSGCGTNQVNNPWGVGCKTEDGITRNRPTNQTSTASSHPSNLGVDGVVSTCASTTTVTNPTWYVDLPGLHVVHGIRFKGGVYVGNTCSNKDITIQVESVLNDTTPAANQSICSQFDGTAHCTAMETINCDSVQKTGNRLLIQYTGRGQLKVCELELIGYQYPYNLAYGKPVMQDGAHDHRHAYLAVDGRLGTRLLDYVCTQTSGKPKPWWWVDLGSQNVVYSVRLLNLDSEGNYHLRLREFTIYVGDKSTAAELSSNAVCHMHGPTPVGAAASEEFQCQNGPLLGRYVIVQLNFSGGDAYLQLCEVMVKGYNEKACPQRYGPDCSRQCDCTDSHVYTCDYINGTCCGQYKKGYRCDQDLPKLTNAPTKESRTDTSIKVKWDAWDTTTGSGSATGVKYEVQYKPNGDSGTPTAVPTQQATERNVTGLQKDTDYCFSVVVLDENNWRGEPSPESCFRTCTDPNDATLGVTAHLDQGSQTESNLDITWNTPIYNCDSGRFELIVQQGIIDCEHISGTPLNTDSAASTFNVTSKIPYTNYTVKMNVINNAGLKKDLCHTIQTPEGVPPSPANAAISSKTPTTITVTWGKPDPPHGIITKYEIQYSNTSEGEITNIKTINESIGSDEITRKIPDLIPNTNYSVKVRAFTIVGHGNWSETLYAITAVGIPEKPQDLRNTSKGQTYIVLAWTAPRITNGQITGYEVTCSPDDIVKSVFGNEELSVNITNLKPSTEYSCRVTASTSAGSGQYSETIQVWTNPKNEVQLINKEDGGNMAGIIGGAVGGVSAILIIVIILIVVLRRKGRGPFAKTTTKSNQELVLSDISQNNPHAEGNSPEAQSDKGGKEHVYTNADESLYGNIDSGTSDVHVDNIWEAMRKKTKEVLKLEYEELPKEFVANCDAGRLKENFHKNRYKNILPYDQTRVVLKTEKDYTSDYINADFMDAYNKSDAFIAAQGPKDLTLIDFWRMLWQCNCPIIVMLTKLVEDGKSKCYMYWPENGSLFYGNFSVTLVDTEEFASFTVRTLSVTKNDERGKKTIKQFHFTAWPDHGVPKYATALLEFQRKVRHYQDSLADDGHVVVHCSAGIGRTGAYIALDFLLAQARSEGKFNVFNQIYSMRTQRAKMIQTLEQYYFVHDALLEALLCGDVIYPCSSFQETYPQLKKKQRKTNKSKIEEQFDVLRLICPVLDKDSYRTAIEPENNSKNRIKNILPANNSRPYLMTPVKGRTDYINAVFIDGFKKKDAYIITQMPLADTVVDFWRMMYDHGSHTIVMLNDLDDESCAVYWPSKGTQQHGPLTVEVKKAKKKDESIMILQLQLTNTEKPDSKPQDIWQFQFKGWQSSKKVPNSTEVFLRLLDEVALWQKQCNDSTITIHCMNGAQRSGLFCAVSVMLEKMKTEQDVDVFQSVKSIRVNRPQLIEDATQLEFCYDVANEYLKGFDTYANFASL